LDRPLIRHLDAPLPWLGLAEYPTPVEPLPEELARAVGARAPAYTKRDDLASPIYGGNKLRSLELHLGSARAQSAELLCVGGASGANYPVAAVLHGARHGFGVRAVLFPQPPGSAQRENLRVVEARAEHVRPVPHWAVLPPALLLERELAQRGPSRRRAFVLPPGGADALGVLGHVSAALELAEQVRAGLLPAPRTVVVGLGSGGTAAGLLLGFGLAARLGVGFAQSPRLIAVRLVLWPLASRVRVLQLASAARRLLHHHAPRLPLPRLVELAAALHVDGTELGKGYGYETRAAEEARRFWHEARLNPLDSIYSAKVAAAFLSHWRAASTRGVSTASASFGSMSSGAENDAAPLLFWSTKSSAPLPRAT